MILARQLRESPLPFPTIHIMKIGSTEPQCSDAIEIYTDFRKLRERQSSTSRNARLFYRLELERDKGKRRAPLEHAAMWCQDANFLDPSARFHSDDADRVDWFCEGVGQATPGFVARHAAERHRLIRTSGRAFLAFVF